MLISAPPAEMFEHAEPSAIWHGGKDGGLECAAGEAAMATAAAPAKIIGVRRARFVIMISAYHQNDERDSRTTSALLSRPSVTYSIVGLTVCPDHGM